MSELRIFEVSAILGNLPRFKVLTDSGRLRAQKRETLKINANVNATGFLAITVILTIRKVFRLSKKMRVVNAIITITE